MHDAEECRRRRDATYLCIGTSVAGSIEPLREPALDPLWLLGVTSASEGLRGSVAMVVEVGGDGGGECGMAVWVKSAGSGGSGISGSIEFRKRVRLWSRAFSTFGFSGFQPAMADDIRPPWPDPGLP